MTSRPLRIAHLADTHLGYRAFGRADPASGRNQRAVDIERAFEAAVDDLLEREVDLVLHAGDVFHHTRPSWSTLRCFVRVMRKIEAAGLPCVVIAGNHDTPRLRTTGSVFGLLELALPETRFVAGYELEEVRCDRLDLTVHAIPHGALTNPNPSIPFLEGGRRNVLLTHGLAPGVKLRGGPREPGEERLSGELLDPELDYVALGHYHIWGDQGHNAYYCGSTERIGWGDEPVAPGYLVVTLGEPGAPPGVEHVPLSARPMKTLHPIDGEGRDARELADLILERVQVLAESAAMVRVEVTKTSRPIRRETEAILRREGGDLVWSLRVFSPADLLTGFEDGVGGPPVADLRTLFTAFVDAQEEKQVYDAAFAAAFRERGGAALTEAIRAAEETAPAEEPAA